jgi:hypothetical protein
MATAVQTPKARPSAAITSPQPAPASAPALPTSESVAESRPYLGDWIAMVVWTGCFGLMVLIHVAHFIVGMFR